MTNCPWLAVLIFVSLYVDDAFLYAKILPSFSYRLFQGFPLGNTLYYSFCSVLKAGCAEPFLGLNGCEFFFRTLWRGFIRIHTADAPERALHSPPSRQFRHYRGVFFYHRCGWHIRYVKFIQKPLKAGVQSPSCELFPPF
jgi:hypothetical protein